MHTVDNQQSARPLMQRGVKRLIRDMNITISPTAICIVIINEQKDANVMYSLCHAPPFIPITYGAH